MRMKRNEKLIRIKRERGMRTLDLSAEAGVGISAIWRAEQGHPGIREETKKKLARALGVRVDEIFPKEHKKTEESPK